MIVQGLSYYFVRSLFLSVRGAIQNSNQSNENKVTIDEIRNSQDNNNDEDRYEPGEGDRNKKSGHKLIYISCAVFFALFVKSDRFNLACRTDQSLECDRIPEKNADEGIPLLSNHYNKNKQLDKCKWCKQHMKPSEPMPIMKFKQESLEESYDSNMAHYDLLTWQMYNRIVSSRGDCAYLPIESVVCASCGSNILFDEALEDHEKDLIVNCEMIEAEDHVFAFSLDP
jgi:hypothetical protein